MGKISIYIKLVDGKLEYRDCEEHHGKTIETEVNPGDKISWVLDENSGISDLSGINIVGSADFLSKGPSKKAKDKWTAKVARKAAGEIAYNIFYSTGSGQINSDKTTLKSGTGFKDAGDEDPPIIKIKK
jgi:hypothetical protein